MIFKVINNRIRYRFCGVANKNKNNAIPIHETENKEKSQCYFTIPYIRRTVQKKITEPLKHANISFAYRSVNKFNKFITVLKDFLPFECKKNIMYKICCKNCIAIYIGQSKRQVHIKNTKITYIWKKNTTQWWIPTEKIISTEPWIWLVKC